MKPRKVYRTRPKKTGAKKTQKIKAQKRMLVALGCDMESLNKLNSVEVRDLLKKKKMRKRGPSRSKAPAAPVKKKRAPKASSK